MEFPLAKGGAKRGAGLGRAIRSSDLDKVGIRVNYVSGQLGIWYVSVDVKGVG